MAITKSDPKVHQINFSYDAEGKIEHTTAHVTYDIFNEDGSVLTSYAETVNMTDMPAEGLALLVGAVPQVAGHIKTKDDERHRPIEASKAKRIGT